MWGKWKWKGKGKENSLLGRRRKLGRANKILWLKLKWKETISALSSQTKKKKKLSASVKVLLLFLFKGLQKAARTAIPLYFSALLIFILSSTSYQGFLKSILVNEMFKDFKLVHWRTKTKFLIKFHACYLIRILSQHTVLLWRYFTLGRIKVRKT